MRKLLDQLYSRDSKTADAARERLLLQRVTREADARAVVEALSRESPGPRTSLGGPEGILLGLIQAPASEEAMEYFRDHASPVIIAAWPRMVEWDRSFALKVLGMIGTREGLAFVAQALVSPEGANDSMLSFSLGGIPSETEHVDVLFPTLTPLLDVEDDRATAVLDLANRLVAAGNLRPHPAATKLDRLRRVLESDDEVREDKGIAVCYALALIPGPASLELLELALKHPDPNVRLEALYGRVRHGVPGAAEALARATLDPVLAQRARKYLEELGKTDLIPEEADDPLLLAKAELVSWLMHPNEFGREPESVELWDRRVLDWPPTRDRRELFLFRYRYPAGKDEEPEEGVGLVGSITFSLMGDTKPSPEGTPEDAYVAHCLWELQQEGDPRAEKMTPEKARKLLGFKPKLAS